MMLITQNTGPRLILEPLTELPSIQATNTEITFTTRVRITSTLPPVFRALLSKGADPSTGYTEFENLLN